MQFKQTKIAGTITVTLGGIVATMSASDAREWLELMSQFAPIALCGWLLYVLYGLERQHDNCRDALLKVYREIADLHREIGEIKADCDKDQDDGK